MSRIFKICKIFRMSFRPNRHAGACPPQQDLQDLQDEQDMSRIFKICKIFRMSFRPNRHAGACPPQQDLQDEQDSRDERQVAGEREWQAGVGFLGVGIFDVQPCIYLT